MSQWRHEVKTVGDRRDWILALLYAPVDGCYAEPIQGRTRLMKGAFLISEKLHEELGRETDFEFQQDEYGPLDPLVFRASEVLDKEDYVDIVPTPDRNGGDRYRLTPDKGEQEAKSIWEEKLKEEEREILKFVRNRHLQQPLSQILNYVYSQYPQYAQDA